MNTFGAIFVFVLAIAAVHSQGNGTDAPPPLETTVVLTTLPPTDPPTTPTTTTQAPEPENTTTTAAPTTPTTTPTPEPTPAENTTTTEAPTTPTTTTEEPTTPTTTPSTPPTTVPTTAGPTTSQEPLTTVAPPTVGTFNNSCIRMVMNAHANVSYVNAANETVLTAIALPTTGATVAPNCTVTATEATLVISFVSAGVTDGVLTFTFTLADGNYKLSAVALTATIETVDVTASAANLALFSTDKGQSYSCNSEQTVALDAGSLLIKDAQVQAFMDDSAAFAAGVECPEDSKTSNIVPIAVGASLAALVVIVLIAYLISRKRNQRGYESV